jgi:hypothetical protein
MCITSSRGGITISIDEYYRVSAAAGYAGSKGSEQDGGAYGQSENKESSNEFGQIFRMVCDEATQEAGGTHQTNGYAIS